MSDKSPDHWDNQDDELAAFTDQLIDGNLQIEPDSIEDTDEHRGLKQTIALLHEGTSLDLPDGNTRDSIYSKVTAEWNKTMRAEGKREKKTIKLGLPKVKREIWTPRRQREWAVLIAFAVVIFGAVVVISPYISSGGQNLPGTAVGISDFSKVLFLIAAVAAGIALWLVSRKTK